VIGGLAVVVGLLLFLEAVWLPALAYAAWGWQVREHDLRVERGVLIRRETSIPLGRIQHVDTRQGPLERLFGLSRLQVFTASGAGADASIPGLDRAIADALRDRLVAKANAERDDGV
jgi:membrane protein YdbS with pleckstrin-like domain